MKYRNEMDFDYIDNYKALLACILAEREITIEKSIELVARQKIGKRIRTKTEGVIGRNHYTVEVYITDILENKVIKFDSSKEAAEFLNVSRATISMSLDKYKKVKKRYIFTTDYPNIAKI